MATAAAAELRERVDATSAPDADDEMAEGLGSPRQSPDRRDRDEDGELEDFGMSDDEDGDNGEPKLDRAMMNELLLVCSNLGMLRVQNEGEQPVLMRGEDCEAWIHDLQRAIRRDHAKHKLVAKQLGKWKILQKKLLPLLVNHQHDWSLVFSILKVLVMLTMKPTKDSTNIAEQLKYLRAYKHEFLRQDVIPIMMNILVEPLSRRGTTRTQEDYLNMEIVLTLIRNLLAIPNEDPRFVTSTSAYLSRLQEDVICTLHRENVYEMILLFAQDIDAPENREWNLLIMEMIDLTLGGSHPKEVAAFAKRMLVDRTPQPEPAASTSETDASSVQRPSSSAKPSRQRTSLEGGNLLQQLNQEKSRSRHRSGASRHSNFGGVLTMKGPTGRETLVTHISHVGENVVPQAPKKPVSRRRGKQQTNPITDINEVFGSKSTITASDEATMSILVEVCDTLIGKSYFQLTNSLKTEFRRGSSKLVTTDRLQYFHLVWFLTSYHRLKIQSLKSHYKHQMKAFEKKKEQLLAAMDFQSPQPTEPEKPSYDEKAVLSTLDMFSFNFVLQSVENYASIKNYHGMTVSVELLTEMMAYIAEMATSDDPRFQRIADSLQHKIFYERDFLDRLPVLLKTWSPGLFTKEYVVDVVTLTHLVFKVLDSQGTIKVLSRRKAYMERKKSKKSQEDGKDGSDDESNDEEESERQAQLLLEMQRKEADFDVRRYFSNILSSETIKMYCTLLASYRENSPKVNHYVHSFFYRVKHFKIHENEEWTMQPLLYNIRVLLHFNEMLQDSAIQRDPAFTGFLDFIRGVVRDFFTLADKNHLLFVESLLRQTYVSRASLLMQRSYDPLDSMSKSKAEAVALGREKRIEQINEVRRQKIAMDHEDLEGEAEFQFSLNPSDFQASSLVTSAGDGAGDDHGAARESTDHGATAAGTDGVPQRQKKRQSTRAGVERAKNWTKVEDRYLAKMFMKYRHLPSVYEVISYEDMFQDRDRTPEQIERRVKYLKLHRKTHDSSDDEDMQESTEDGKASDQSDVDFTENAGTGATAATESRSRRRLRRAAKASDDSDSDDDLMLGDSLQAQNQHIQSSPRASEDTNGPSIAERDEATPTTIETSGDEQLSTDHQSTEIADTAITTTISSTISADKPLPSTSETQDMEELEQADVDMDADDSIVPVVRSADETPGVASEDPSPLLTTGDSEPAVPIQSLKRDRDPEIESSELEHASPAKKVARAPDDSVASDTDGAVESSGSLPEK